MKSVTSTIVLAAIIAGVGFYYWRSQQKTILSAQPLNLKTYSSDKYSFRYPADYIIEKNFGIGKETDSLSILAVKKDGGRLEIFQMKDFGDRAYGIEIEASEKEIDDYIPKESLSVGTRDQKYDVWLFYNKDDSQTKKELHDIFDSIIVK